MKMNSRSKCIFVKNLLDDYIKQIIRWSTETEQMVHILFFKTPKAKDLNEKDILGLC